MKSLSKFIIVITVVLFANNSVKAQNGLEMNVNYNVGLPTAGSKDYVTKPSFRGFTGSLDYAITSQLRVGLGIGFNDYYQKYPRQVYNGSDGAISAVLSNSIQQTPLIAHINYTITKTGFIRPYVGAGAGVNFISFDQYLGEFDNPSTKAKAIVQGEAGVFIPVSRYSSTAVKIGGTYNFAPFNEFGTSNLNSWGVQAGIRFPLH